MDEVTALREAYRDLEARHRVLKDFTQKVVEQVGSGTWSDVLLLVSMEPGGPVVKVGPIPVAEVHGVQEVLKR